MNKRLPYEEQLAEQLKEVSLPDENMAWADMKRRLDEDDDDRVIPFWLSGCLLWTLLGVVVLTLGWWIVRPEKWFGRKKLDKDKISISKSTKERPHNSPGNVDPRPDSSISFETDEKHSPRRKSNRKITSGSDKEEGSTKSAENSNVDGQKYQREKKSRSGRAGKDISSANNGEASTKAKQADGTDSGSLHDEHLVAGSSGTDLTNDTTKKAKTEKKVSDSVLQNARKDMKANKAKSLELSFAAGISVHQQLPIAGQNFVPYNREGRKGTLSDYIPAVYLRMYHKNSWFVQSEFRYGAPQYTKEFLYQQRSDSAINGYITQSTSLKKTYYHQLPLTFNYFVSKNFSVGSGIVWNRFVSAVSSQDVIKHNNQTGTDSIISKGTVLVPKITDSGSVFVRSWFQALFEAEYKWKKFSVGARYAVGLEPYIKFELQPGVPQQEKNNAVDIFLRYELWRSKKK